MAILPQNYYTFDPIVIENELRHPAKAYKRGSSKIEQVVWSFRCRLTQFWFWSIKAQQISLARSCWKLLHCQTSSAVARFQIKVDKIISFFDLLLLLKYDLIHLLKAALVIMLIGTILYDKLWFFLNFFAYTKVEVWILILLNVIGKALALNLFVYFGEFSPELSHLPLVLELRHARVLKLIEEQRLVRRYIRGFVDLKHGKLGQTTSSFCHCCVCALLTV